MLKINKIKKNKQNISVLANYATISLSKVVPRTFVRQLCTFSV